ncbi:MAG: hypothetical protein DCC75_04740, partial [Proteobacteria bacterium]
MERITLYSLSSDYSSKLYNSGRWIDGAAMRALEERLQDYLGVKFIVLTNSGTSSLLAAYWALKDRFPQGIITCPYTWPATYQTSKVLGIPTRYTRLVCRSRIDLFGDSSDSSIVALVHLFGQPQPHLPRLMESGQPFIEDAAQAFGAEYNGKKVGTFGMIGCYSFYPTKTLHTCGHGGALSTDDEDLYREMKLFVECGRWEGKVTQAVALNLRMDEIKAEFLVWELERYDERMRTQRDLAKEFQKLIPGPQPFIEEAPNSRHIYSVFNLLLDKREDFRSFMNDRGIDTMVYYNQDVLPEEVRGD